MIAIGSDHAGFALKQQVAEHLKQQGVAFDDFGCHSPEAVDYPDVAEKVARAVADGTYEKGILICGTGIGIGMAANKVRGVRAALCHDVFSAQATRAHNDANILTMGERVIGPGHAMLVVDAFLSTPFEGGRHQRRVDKIMALEEKDTGWMEDAQ